MDDVEKIKLYREFKQFKKELLRLSFSSAVFSNNYIIELFKNVDLYIEYIDKFYIKAELFSEYYRFWFYYDDKFLYDLGIFNKTELAQKLKIVFRSDKNFKNKYT